MNFFSIFVISLKVPNTSNFFLYHGPRKGPYWYTSLYQFVERGRGTGRDVAASQSSVLRSPVVVGSVSLGPLTFRRCANLSAQKFVVQKSEEYAYACSETSVGSLSPRIILAITILKRTLGPRCLWAPRRAPAGWESREKTWYTNNQINTSIQKN